MQEQEIAKRKYCWQDTAAETTKNELQSVIKKDNRKRNVDRTRKTSRWETAIPDKSTIWFS